MTFEEFQNNVRRWSADQGVYSDGSGRAELLKFVAEIGRLCYHDEEGDRGAKADAIGFAMMRLVNYCELSLLNFESILLQSWQRMAGVDIQDHATNAKNAKTVREESYQQGFNDALNAVRELLEALEQDEA